MTPLEVFRRYCAVKTHFTNPRYDYLMSGGATRAGKAAFDRRRDKYYFEKISRNLHDLEVVPFFVCNFLENTNAWVGDISDFDLDSEPMRVFREYRTRMLGLRTQVLYDFENVHGLLDGRVTKESLFFESDGEYPIFFQLLRRKMIHPETFVAANLASDMINKASQELKEDPIWMETTFTLDKYSRFLPIESMRKMIPLWVFEGPINRMLGETQEPRDKQGEQR